MYFAIPEAKFLPLPFDSFVEYVMELHNHRSTEFHFWTTSFSDSKKLERLKLSSNPESSICSRIAGKADSFDIMSRPNSGGGRSSKFWHKKLLPTFEVLNKKAAEVLQGRAGVMSLF